MPLNTRRTPKLKEGARHRWGASRMPPDGARSPGDDRLHPLPLEYDKSLGGGYSVFSGATCRRSVGNRGRRTVMTRSTTSSRPRGRCPPPGREFGEVGLEVDAVEAEIGAAAVLDHQRQRNPVDLDARVVATGSGDRTSIRTGSPGLRAGVERERQACRRWRGAEDAGRRRRTGRRGSSGDETQRRRRDRERSPHLPRSPSRWTLMP